MRKPYLMILMLTGVSVLSGMHVNPPLEARAFCQQQKSHLHDRAKQGGGKLVEKFKADRSAAYPNLTEIAKRSTAIIIGHTVANRAHLTTDGNFITTDFSVVVKEVTAAEIESAIPEFFDIQAEMVEDIGHEAVEPGVGVGRADLLNNGLRAGSVVLVSLPGGAHRFEDGVTAFLYAGNYRPAENGKTYVFFLDKMGAVSKGWELAGGIQGQFELDFASGKVIPAGTAGHDPLVDRYRDKPIKDLLVELHQAVGNPKHTK